MDTRAWTQDAAAALQIARKDDRKISALIEMLDAKYGDDDALYGMCIFWAITVLADLPRMPDAYTAKPIFFDLDENRIDADDANIHQLWSGRFLAAIANRDEEAVLALRNVPTTPEERLNRFKSLLWVASCGLEMP